MIRAQSRKITVVNVMTIVFLEEIEKNIRFQLKMIRLDSVQDTTRDYDGVSSKNIACNVN